MPDSIDHPFTADDLQLLAQWDTPTICNGLELVCPERRAIGFTTRPLVCLDETLPPIVGYACTARIRAQSPADIPAAGVQQRRQEYYAYLDAAPGPGVIVIEDLDDPAGFGAWWGEVHTAIHRGLGFAAGITNGSMRDLPDAAPGFQLLAGQVGPSHAHVHLEDFGEKVTVHNMTVSHGDIIHCDCHGAVVIPATAVTELPGAIDLLTRREAVVLAAARADGLTAAKLQAAMQEAAAIQ